MIPQFQSENGFEMTQFHIIGKQDAIQAISSVRRKYIRMRQKTRFQLLNFLEYCRKTDTK